MIRNTNNCTEKLLLDERITNLTKNRYWLLRYNTVRASNEQKSFPDIRKLEIRTKG